MGKRVEVEFLKISQGGGSRRIQDQGRTVKVKSSWKRRGQEIRTITMQEIKKRINNQLTLVPILERKTGWNCRGAQIQRTKDIIMDAVKKLEHKHNCMDKVTSINADFHDMHTVIGDTGKTIREALLEEEVEINGKPQRLLASVEMNHRGESWAYIYRRVENEATDFLAASGVYLEKKYGAAAMMAYTSTGKYRMEDYVWSKEAGGPVAREDQEWANVEQPEWANERYAKEGRTKTDANLSGEAGGQGKEKTKGGGKKKGVGFEALENRTKYDMDLAGETRSFYTEREGQAKRHEESVGASTISTVRTSGTKGTVRSTGGQSNMTSGTRASVYAAALAQAEERMAKQKEEHEAEITRLREEVKAQNESAGKRMAEKMAEMMQRMREQANQGMRSEQGTARADGEKEGGERCQKDREMSNSGKAGGTKAAAKQGNPPAGKL